MPKLSEFDHLRNNITTEWTVNITDHDYLNDSRDGVAVQDVMAAGVVLRPAQPWGSQGTKRPTTIFTWSGDLEVDGNTVRLFHTPPPHTGKTRRLVKTYEFIPPKG